MAPKKKSKKMKSKSKIKPKKKAAIKKAPLKKAMRPKKAAPKKKPAAKKPKSRGRDRSEPLEAFEPKGLGPDSGGQSGDLQGLSNTAEADSESVDELLEEGNAFEAEVVDGVENAPDADEGEVRTHEVPEDDVPDEYTDKDQ
jgi:N utilization substance protein A